MFNKSIKYIPAIWGITILSSSITGSINNVWNNLEEYKYEKDEFLKCKMRNIALIKGLIDGVAFGFTLPLILPIYITNSIYNKYK